MALAGGVAQRHHLGVGAAGCLGLSLADHVALSGHQDAAHGRVWRGLVLRLLGKLKGEVYHEGEFTVWQVVGFMAKNELLSGF